MSEFYNCRNCKYGDSNIGLCSMCVSNTYRPDLRPSYWEPKVSDNQLEKTNDPVNHPNHYQTKSGLETIQVIEAFTEGLEGIYAVDTANVIKYICRWKKKNGLQDLKKAQWYLNNLIDHVESNLEEEDYTIPTETWEETQSKQKTYPKTETAYEVQLRKLKDACDLVFDAWKKWPDELMEYNGSIGDFLEMKHKEEKENK